LIPVEHFLVALIDSKRFKFLTTGVTLPEMSILTRDPNLKIRMNGYCGDEEIEVIFVN
jgi:hypothetical protein